MTGTCSANFAAAPPGATAVAQYESAQSSRSKTCEVPPIPEIRLSQGLLRYRDRGSGPCIVLIHGLFVNSTGWDRLAPLFTQRGRCVMPDLPLGAHRTPMNGADLSPPGPAQMIAELIQRPQLREVTVLGNDTGGALCQILCANHRELVDRLVLTNCDAFEHFPPAAFRAIERAGGRIPGLIKGLDLLLRARLPRRAAMAAVPLTIQPLPDELSAAWFEPMHDRRIRAEQRAVLQGISPEHTLAAAERLKTFDRPALIAWGTRDRILPGQRRRTTRSGPPLRAPGDNRQRPHVRPARPTATSRGTGAG